MKGFIEITQLVWEANSESDSPFDGQYVSGAKVLINISSISFIDGNFIKTNALHFNENGTFDRNFHSKESYEEIKRLIQESTI